MEPKISKIVEDSTLNEADSTTQEIEEEYEDWRSPDAYHR